MKKPMNFPNISNTRTPEITWEKLFPRCIRPSLHRGIDDKESIKPEDLFSDGTVKITKYIVFKLLPRIYRTMPNGSDITAIGDSTFSKYWTYSAAATSSTRYGATIDELICKGTTGKYAYESFDFNKELIVNIENLLSWLHEDELSEYKDYIEKLITVLPKISSLKRLNIDKVFAKEDMKVFSKRLSCLVAIAATWPVWTEQNTLSSELALLLFPSTDDDPITDEWLDNYIETKKDEAEKKLTNALNQLDDHKYIEACDIFKEIIESMYVDDIVRGEAYYNLSVYCTKKIYQYKGPLSPSTFLEKAADFGHTEASKLLEKSHRMNYRRKSNASLLYEPMRSTAKAAYIITNTTPENACMRAFLKTMPESMESESNQREYLVYAKSTEDLLSVLTPDNELKYLFIDDSFSNNFNDFIHVLDKIKFWYSDTSKPAVNWSKITFYLRLNEEKYSALIDTALKRIGNICVRIHIIDDGKWPAQYLLSRKPLFMGLQDFNSVDLHKMKKKININYVVITSQNDDLTNWLIREAYWLGCFYYSNITFSISVISPEAQQIEARLRFDCPDIFSPDIPDSNKVSKVVVNPCTLIDNLSSSNLFSELVKLNRQGDNTLSYYVVHAGDDVASMNLSIKIREWTIRNQLEEGKRPDRVSLPTIAFYCTNSDIGYLSNKLIVQTMDHGNNWYNNYNIIPFGMISDRYAWDEIDGGYFEKMAQCTHLQYSGIEISATEEEIKDGLTSYFNRSYNRDSSMAVALSLPYRLFQTPAIRTSKHIMPPNGWDIMNANFFDDPDEFTDILSEMADHFKKSIKNDDILKQNLLYYEHSRWLRWAISRGWVKANVNDVITYMKAGNPKQQLFIAKMHGCICSVEDLKYLSQEMCRNANEKNWERFAEKRESIHKYLPKNFVTTDTSNIEKTPEILQTKWLEVFRDKPSNEPEH